MERDLYFDISRKIVANMTTESWQSVPHVSVLLEANVGLLLSVLNEYNTDHTASISINSATLKIIAEGLRANPRLNGYIKYNSWLVSGRFVPAEHVDVSMPILYDNNKMITVILPRVEELSMLQVQREVIRIRERVTQTDMPKILYKTGLADTFEGLRHGKVATAAGRLIGAKFGKGRVKIKAESVPANPSALTPKNIRQGSVTVSNMGSLCKEWNGNITLLEIVPPQVCAIGIGALQKKPQVDEDDRIVISDILPLTIAFDHRALDFAEVAPFIGYLNQALRNEEKIRAWLE